jgi:hypothetical protein
MVSTPNLLLPLMATSSNVGLWGGVLNSQSFSVLDLQLGGRNAPDVTGSSNYTLSADEAKNLYQAPHGVLSGNIDYILPATSGRDYIVFNNTTGAFTLTVKPSGGTGIVVPQGVTYRIFINPDTSSAVAGGFITTPVQYSYIASNVTLVNSTTLTDITGLSVSVLAGGTYNIDAAITFSANSSDGLKLALSGTCTATDVATGGIAISPDSNAGTAQTVYPLGAASLNSNLFAVTAKGFSVMIHGYITVATSGTLTLQMASNVASGHTLQASKGGWFNAWRVG